MNLVELIRTRLTSLEPVRMDIRDESHLHAGHAGSKGGGAHFKLSIVAPIFAGKTTMERHRMVYDALGSLMKHEIHALGITAQSPEET